jgi:TM2 domain-containing membrane protein YozV
MKSKNTAYLLWFFGLFGWLGLHRFYLRKYATGILWIVTGGVLGIGSLYDLFALGDMVDLHNMRTKNQV